MVTLAPQRLSDHPAGIHCGTGPPERTPLRDHVLRIRRVNVRQSQVRGTEPVTGAGSGPGSLEHAFELVSEPEALCDVLDCQHGICAIPALVRRGLLTRFASVGRGPAFWPGSCQGRRSGKRRARP